MSHTGDLISGIISDMEAAIKPNFAGKSATEKSKDAKSRKADTPATSGAVTSSKKPENDKKTTEISVEKAPSKNADSASDSRQTKSPNKENGDHSETEKTTVKKTDNKSKYVKSSKKPKGKTTAKDRSTSKTKPGTGQSDELEKVRTELKEISKSMNLIKGLGSFMQEMREFKDSFMDVEDGELSDDNGLEEDNAEPNQDAILLHSRTTDNSAQEASTSRSNDNRPSVQAANTSSSNRQADKPGSDTSGSSNSAQILDDLVHELENTEQCGPPIQQKLADLMDTICKTGMQYDKVTERIKDSLRPSNCNGLSPAKVNTDIWNSLRNDTRHKDLRYQRTLETLSVGVSRVAEVTSMCLDNVQEDETVVLCAKTAIGQLTKALIMLCETVHDINMKRRDNIRPELNQDYMKTLTAADNPVTSMLFGDDPQKVAKESSDTKKLTKPNGPSYSTRGGSRKRFQPYNVGTRGRGDFLGRGRGQRGRGRWQARRKPQSQWRQPNHRN